MQAIIRYIFCFLLFVFCYQPSAYADRGGFYYKKIRFEAHVFEHNLWDITETYELDFLEPRHGFYRIIPLDFSLYHDTSENFLSLKRKFKYVPDISYVSVVGGKNEQYDENGYRVVKIGSPNKTVIGPKTYELSYYYLYPDDRLDYKDFLFHTILGADFNEDIDRLEFDIRFDKPLPKEALDNLKFYRGKFGLRFETPKPDDFVATPTRISGSCDNVRHNSAVSIYMDLPEGYYEGVKKTNHIWHYIWLGLTIICLIYIITRALMLNRGRDVVKTIEFYPPEGISSAEVGVIIDTDVDNIDVVSLIPWFAEQGYLKIEEKGKRNIVLTKVMDLPDNAPEYQKQFMDILFGEENTVEMNDMECKASEMSKMKSSLKHVFSENGKQELVRTDQGIYAYFFLLIFSTLTLATNVVREFEWEQILFMGVMWFIPSTICLCTRRLGSFKDLFSSVEHKMRFIAIKFIIMAVIAVCYVLFYKEYGTPLNGLMVLLFFLVNFIAIELCGRFTVNTDYRINMTGRLLGFKEFIETAEKPYLEKLQMEDAQYFYRVLPYAMVFKLADKWSKKFENIFVEKPDWYSTTISDFSSMTSGDTMHNFTSHIVNNMNDTISDHISSISHLPSSGSDSDFSSGGGFSGGGGGGGGGGSW